MIVGNNVYDITQYIRKHPGGVDIIMIGAGKDATEMFYKIHPYIAHERILKDFFLGFIKRESRNLLSV